MYNHTTILAVTTGQLVIIVFRLYSYTVLPYIIISIIPYLSYKKHKEALIPYLRYKKHKEARQLQKDSRSVAEHISNMGHFTEEQKDM